MGVFSKNDGFKTNLKRNTFDLSFQNSLTMQFGKLYPCLCKEVLPGDTFRIDSAFGLRFMPLAFPVQTKMRADIHYFYVRNRNLWKDWPNFIGLTGADNLQLPYKRYQDVCSTGELGDYLGIPTTVIGKSSTPINLGAISSLIQSTNPVTHWYMYSASPDLFGSDSFGFTIVSAGAGSGYLSKVDVQSTSSKSLVSYVPITSNLTLKRGQSLSFNISLNGEAVTYKDFNFYLTRFTSQFESVSEVFSKGIVSNGVLTFNVLRDTKFTGLRIVIFRDGIYNGQLDFNPNASEAGFISSNLVISNGVLSNPRDNVSEASSLSNISQAPNVSALPFRAYESIYNAFYRDNRNNPFIVNGVTDPNVYLPTKEGGLDTYPYRLHFRNWEQDFLTSAVPTPQQGVAPLVGLSTGGRAEFHSTDGNTYSVQLTTADDGDTITAAKIPDGTPSDVTRQVVNLATQGISINDLRGVNAFQRFLETNIRKGLKYKDQIESHFGVNVSYAELDMPEFIGGHSCPVNIDQINQTAQSESDPLASYAGQASAIGSNNHTITHYCDEHGYIIGIISIVPVPTYSQLLPKHFLKSSPLDYFFPEFGHIGLQPIKYNEVCPLQVLSQGSNLELTDTFGYQRAWYDYLASTDEVHSLFRSNLQSFILSRVYNTPPSLNPEFLTVRPEQLNQIFTVTEAPDSEGKMKPVDPILGQIHFKILCKRPIPRFGVPKLE